jgi:hypothetical protein
MAAQPEHRENRPPYAGAQITVVEAARRVDRRALWVSAIAAAGVFSVGAGAIHASAASYQMRVSPLYGLTFVAFAIGQIGWGMLAAAFPSRAMAILGALGNAAVFATWVITRTVGVPSGPLAGGTLTAGFPDSVATTLEGLAVVAAVGALLASRRRRTAGSGARMTILVAAAAVAIPLATLAVLSQAGILPALPPSI